MSSVGLAHVTNEALQAELDRRKAAKAAQDRAIEPLSVQHFDKVSEAAKQHVAHCIATKCTDNDDEHYIYEAVMEAVYGPDFWDWWNKQEFNQ